MEPPLICFNKLLTSLIYSFVDIFSEKKYLTSNYLGFFSKYKGGLKKAPKIALHYRCKVVPLPIYG